MIRRRTVIRPHWVEGDAERLPPREAARKTYEAVLVNGCEPGDDVDQPRAADQATRPSHRSLPLSAQRPRLTCGRAYLTRPSGAAACWAATTTHTSSASSRRSDRRGRELPRRRSHDCTHQRPGARSDSCHEKTILSGSEVIPGGHSDPFGRSNRGENKRRGTDLSGSARFEPNGRRPVNRLDLVFRLSTRRRVQLNGAHAALSRQV